MDAGSRVVTRRDFLHAGIGVAAAETSPRWASATNPAVGLDATKSTEKKVGIQISAVSFVDEGVNKVLDILQERREINTPFFSTVTYDATLAALTAGAQGVVFSRKYSEMRLANLSAGGASVKEFQKQRE
jgi:hypothetical protein